MPVELIIWDCDGCLIDSELIACSVSADMFTAMGYPITAQEMVERFAGIRGDEIFKIIEAETGRSFRAEFPFEEKERRRKQVFEQQLKAIPHVVETLDQLGLPMCIASGSDERRLKQTLGITGLYDRFEGRIFNSAQVARGKPAPDIFLFAAAQMKADLAHCLVIEDSPFGVAGAKAAGMPVFGFAGASHVNAAWRERLTLAGADLLFDDMRRLPELVAAL